MGDQTQERLLEFGQPHHVRGRALRFPPMSLMERLRVARRLPQAVVKVTSFSQGRTRVSAHLRYISRNGQLTVEKDDGEILTDREQQQELVGEWAMDFDYRKNSRDTANIVFSLPCGSDVQGLRKIVRHVGATKFRDHEWMFALHDDTKHLHAHLVVKMKSREGARKLQLKKADLYQLRQRFAEAAREQGIALAASPRAARGVGRKGVRQAMYRLRQKGVTPAIERAAAQEAVTEFQTGTREPKPWERAMAQRHQRERAVYAAYAERLRALAAEREGVERERLLTTAAELAQFADTMPTPRTRRQAWIERMTELAVLKRQKHQQRLARAKDRDIEIER